MVFQRPLHGPVQVVAEEGESNPVRRGRKDFDMFKNKQTMSRIGDGEPVKVPPAAVTFDEKLDNRKLSPEDPGEGGEGDSGRHEGEKKAPVGRYHGGSNKSAHEVQWERQH